ncbi:hypothetical protein AB685_14250 [Bacillus sp. LL01]|uniref:hypothetical protein n=1 Tax=Bacillus sp. LL01 TaxID=1665556 RepID=UPI00064CEA62|nr:hypothetical protein [Bacillus sp. LL01]KMJ57984.1 hypothetical protein AB685_14250 [Bacillus sp. LL01]
MFIALTITIILSVFLMLSLRYLKFEILELTLLFLFSSYICQNTFYKLFSPYDRISIADSGWAKLTVKLHFGITLPVLLIIVLYILKCTSFSYYVASGIGWIVIVIVSEKALLLSGILETQNEKWVPLIDIAASIFILLLTNFVWKTIHILLKKEQVIT